MSTESIRIDYQSPARPFKRVWEFGFNTCHAPIVMRSDLQGQMKTAVSDLGMRYWRAHGTLSDDVGIVIEQEGTRAYAFSGLKRLLDRGLQTGIKPFFELSFMPRLLARDTSQTITHYQGITSAPKSFGEWRELIDSLFGFLVETYGIEELATWYFEVWNEPNIGFWRGTQAEYFELYRQAALGIKAVDPRLRVGGPATARAEWAPEFLRFCAETNTPVDFLSVHIYPSDIAFSESASGEVQLLGMDFLYQNFAKIKRIVEDSGRPLPIIWGEWNSSAGPLALNHDEANNAPFLCAAVAGMEKYADGSLYWNLSDIYEEGDFHFTPFHGGYGLFTVDDIPKSSARAFEFLRRLEPLELTVETQADRVARGILASRDAAGTRFAAVAWNYVDPASAETVPWRIELALANASVDDVELHEILPGEGSAYEKWLAMGSPATLSVPQLHLLKEASRPRMSRKPWGSSRNLLSLSVQPGSVVLITGLVRR